MARGPLRRLRASSCTAALTRGPEQLRKAGALLIGQRWRFGQNLSDVAFDVGELEITPSIDQCGVVRSLDA
ncbi:hypothetical protein BJF87_16840 [Gordonia sp. CNJ-863]|nr:hypothetical protein BJF87_16840 [Gordonia sp. CNJ-863]